MPQIIEDIISYLKQHKLLFSIISISLISVILFLFYFLSTDKKENKTAPTQVKTSQTSPKTSDKNIAVPSPISVSEHSPSNVSFAKYENPPSMPIVPSNFSAYTFQTNFTYLYALELGKKLGLTKVKTPDDRYIILYNFTDSSTMGELVFDKLTGGFMFQSWGNHTLPNSSGSTNPLAIGKSYLNYLGLTDDTIMCSVTYNKKSKPSVTFVECHRDWQKTGLPILNAVGVVNIPEETKLSDLALGNSDNNIDDNLIINTSSNQDGKARPKDFNTATVGIDKDGRIVSVESNIRPIKETNTYTSDHLISPQEAFSQFISHKSQFALTIPGGSGFINPNKIYQGNILQGQKAVISDYLLTYIEKPQELAQDKLVPMYLIRGTAELSSGNTVRFTEMVPAMRNGSTFMTPYESKLDKSTENNYIPLLSSTKDSQSVKLGSFVPSTPTPSPTEFGRSNLCPNTNWSGGFSDKEFTIDIPGLGQLQIGSFTNETQSSGHIFWYKCSTFPINDIEQVRDIFFNGPITNQYLINVSRWISNNSNFSPSRYKNIQDMYKLFLEINGRSTCEAGLAPPVPNCEQEVGHQGFYNAKRINAISESVGYKMLDIITKSEISSWSNKQDIFLKRILPELSFIFMDFDPNANNDSHYISGESPSLYFYPDKTQDIDISLGMPLTYTNPSYGTGWHVKAYADGNLITLSNLLPYRRLYYEYDKRNISFHEKEEGFIVERNNWEHEVQSIASDLKLNYREMEDLLIDVRNTLSNLVTSPFIKISIIDKTEVEKGLPLTIIPKPDKIYRIHFMITPLYQSNTINKPYINPIKRKGFTVIEVGVYSDSTYLIPR